MPATVAADVEGARYKRDTRVVHRAPWMQKPRLIFFFSILMVLGLGINVSFLRRRRVVDVPKDLRFVRARCENLRLSPGPPPGFNFRTSSDRSVPGTKSILIRNATIWTGNDDGKEVAKGDILLDEGLIKLIGNDIDLDAELLNGLSVIDAEGGWVTPGIVDLHSHLGVFSVPIFLGAVDGSSDKGIVQPWLRSLDGLNTHDDTYKLSVSGGVTTALVLPGSQNGIGGQAFTIKLRPTAERTPTSLLLEPPFALNNTHEIDWSLPPRWRHMKHACGENPSSAFGNSRMDNVWAFREIYDKARKIKEGQDAYCARAVKDDWIGLGAFPEELKYEAVVDVLRGRVRVHLHCYEAVDLDDIIRLTNEFEFPIAAFHHASEAYLVPDLLKKAYGQAPASAMFGTYARYKRESYRGSEFAPRILAEKNISVVMKSDHPVLNSRYLVYEAQQAHYFGLPENLAIASITSTPARVMGMDHRIGFIRTGYDADLVLWDSHPLVLGSTPRQVFIDGVAQFDGSYAALTLKSEAFQKVPEMPSFDKESDDAVEYEGLPPLEPRRSVDGLVVFTNITSFTTRAPNGTIVNGIEVGDGEELGVLVARAGEVVCWGVGVSCSQFLDDPDSVTVDLNGGTISPGLISFGSNLGLEEIQAEASTKDGLVLDRLDKDLPRILGDGALVRAVDGLQFATRNAFLAYRAGVTIGVSAPLNIDFLTGSSGFISGISSAFSLGSAHKLQEGALVKDVVSMHVSIGHSIMGRSASVSTQVAALRRSLLDPPAGDTEKWFKEVANGTNTLVVHAESADIISTLLLLKKEVEEHTGANMKLTIAGGTESHLLAAELAEAGVGVIIAPLRSLPKTWEKRRILPGPPITRDSSISLLLRHNVTVGIGVDESWAARNTRFDIAWVALEAAGEISRTQALALASTNLESLLGLNIDPELSDLVATEKGDLLGFEGKVVGIIAPRKGVVDLF